MVQVMAVRPLARHFDVAKNSGRLASERSGSGILKRTVGRLVERVTLLQVGGGSCF